MRYRVLGFLVTALLCMACAQPRPEADRTASDQPKTGGTVNVHTFSDPFDWDPSNLLKVPNGPGWPLSYESLLGFRAGPDVKYDEIILRPELAERWEVSPDARSFTFTLRKGVRFADLPPLNGRELTSADVKWSFEYMSRTGRFEGDTKLQPSVNAWMFEGIDRIETPDTHTVAVRFKQPFAPFLTYSASDYNPIVPHEIYDSDGNFKSRMAGSGPWQLDTQASQSGSRWVWKRNPTYWDAGKPHIDQVRWLVLPDSTSASTAFQTQQLDILSINNVQDAEEMRRANPRAVVDEHVNPQPTRVQLNTRRPPLDDVRVRRALQLATDREQFIKVLSGGKGAWALLGGFATTYSQEEIKRLAPYDIEQARRLLREAGHANGVEVPFTYPASASSTELARMQLYQAQLKEAGISLKLQTVDAAEYSAARKRGTFSMNITGMPMEPDVDAALTQHFHSSSAASYHGLKDARLDAVIDAQRQTVDPVKRQELVREAMRLINVDLIPGIGLYYNVEYQFWQPYVRNYADSWANQAWPLRDAWLDK